MNNIVKLTQNNFIRRLEELTTKIFLFGTSFILIFLGLTIILASFNYFKFIPVLCAFIISCIMSFLYLLYIKKDVRFFPRISLLVIFIVLLVSLVIIFYPHDNFGGTDNGVYINLAFHLAKNGSFNMPEYYQGSWIEAALHSVVAYRTWLATQKILFGTAMAVRGNFLLIVLGLLSFFSVSSLISNKKTGFISVALFATSMPLLWFARVTLTENLAFLLLWTAIFYFIIYTRTGRFIYLIYLIITMSLLSLARPEGVFILLFMLFALIVFLIYKNIISKKKLIFIILVGILLILSLWFISFQSAYYSVLTSLWKGLKADITYIFYGKPFLLQRYPLFFLQMLIKYNLLLTILFIFIILFQLINSFMRRRAGNYYFIALVFIILPEFYKLIDPAVGFHQPWVYRRYLYALIPLGYLSVSLFLSRLKNKKISIIIFCLLISINLILSYPLIFVKNNWGIYDVLEKITNTVSSNDLIIIKDSYILGHYWPNNYFVFQKLIRTIYSSEVDYKQLLLKEKKYKGFSFNMIYYLSDSPNEYYKNYSLTYIRSFDFNFVQVKPSCELEYMGYELNYKDYSLIPYSSALNYCKYPYNEIINFSKKLYIYRLN